MFGLFKKKKEEAPVMTPEDYDPAAAEVSAPVEEKPEAKAAPERDVFVPPPGLMHGMHGSHIGGLEYSPIDPGTEFKAKAGAPLEAGQSVADIDTVIDALRTVYDPEIPVNLFDLGLIYDCKIAENGNVNIEMSLTAPGCPVAGEMPGMVARAVEGVDGTGEIEVLLVWEPQWTPEMMSEDAKLALGMG